MSEADQTAHVAGERKCPQCGVEFTCGVTAGQSQCWCFHLPRIITEDESDNRGCLCPACLGAKIEQLNPRQAT